MKNYKKKGQNLKKIEKSKGKTALFPFLYICKSFNFRRKSYE